MGVGSWTVEEAAATCAPAAGIRRRVRPMLNDFDYRILVKIGHRP
jgi:hypothetical protein